jgi:hypothetical protein
MKRKRNAMSCSNRNQNACLGLEAREVNNYAQNLSAAIRGGVRDGVAEQFPVPRSAAAHHCNIRI